MNYHNSYYELNHNSYQLNDLSYELSGNFTMSAETDFCPPCTGGFPLDAFFAAICETNDRNYFEGLWSATTPDAKI